jgi:hypothetical protein
MKQKNPIDLYNLAKCSVQNENGEPIELGTLWREQRTMLIFLRHFACIACRAHATQVWQRREFYERNKVNVAFIGNGNAHFIENFKKDLGLTGAQVYTDPSLATFRLCGFRRGFLALVSVKTIANASSLYAKGNRQTQLTAEGDHWQLGGVVVITPDNKVPFHFISEALGDFPPEKDAEAEN